MYIERQKTISNKSYDHFTILCLVIARERVASQSCTSPRKLPTECRTDTQASELPRRILSPANELVNVTRGGCDRCPLWIDVLCNEGHWPTEKCWWSSRLEACTSPQPARSLWVCVNAAMRTGSYQWTLASYQHHFMLQIYICKYWTWSHCDCLHECDS